MASHQPALMKSLQHLFHQGAVTGLDDGQLLERFVARQDETAFAALVARHGPLVLGVCSRILRDEHDIEDAFQATFLVLVRRAGSIRDAGRLGPWLHGVARRVAARARSESALRQARHCHSTTAVEDVAMRTEHQTELDDLAAVIDEEIARLPARYRDAVVLCDLEGRSYAVAAGRLRCPLGTIQSRLARGRARLRSRLIRRGLAPIALEALLSEGASAAVPELLAEATVQAAVALVVGKVAAAAAVSVTAVALASFVTTRIRIAMMQRIALAFAAVSIAIGAGFAASSARSDALAPVAARAVRLQRAEDAESVRTLHIEALSKEDGSPLAKATVWVRATRGRIYTWDATTDDQGCYDLVLPSPMTNVDVVVARAGYVTGGASGLPRANYKLPLERSETIGGIVRDEEGHPIEGARVLPVSYNFKLIWPEIYASPKSSLAIATTDGRGRWRAEALPEDSGADAPLIVMVTHPDYITTELRTTAAKARAFSIEQVMKTGVSVSGTVLSPFGRPVLEATVVVTMPQWERMFLRLTTDQNGQFHSGRCVDPLRATPAMTVLAPGLAMAAREIVVRADSPAQVVRLTRRRPIEGRVVDTEGHPVVGAAVSPSQRAFIGMLDWDADTDSDGRFVWYDAPTTDTILLDVSKPNYRPIRERVVDPETGEFTITLHHRQRLHGTVADAATGRPVERFTLIHGTGPSLPGMRPVWDREHSRPFTSGHFDLNHASARDDNSRQSIRIEADGYQPGEFLGFPGDAEDVIRDFQLRKATPFSGVVRGPDSRPLVEADVALGEIEGPVHLFYYWMRMSANMFPSMRTKTDGNGRFSLPFRDRKAWIVVVHKTGVAVRSPEQLDASAEIALIPWGRIEGVMKIGGKSARGQRVLARLNGRGFDGVVEHTARTDHDGQFKIDYVAPGVHTVGRQVPDADADGGGMTLSNPVDVAVAPGQTVHVEIGGTGRPVIGQFASPEGARMSDLASGHVVLRSQPAVLRMPAGFMNLTDEQWSVWWEGFRGSPEGWAYLEGERRFAVAIRPDGTFRIEDVPAGRYVLKLSSRSSVGDNSSGRVAFARSDVEVPEIAGGRSDVPLDIGPVPVTAVSFRELNVGDRVPEISAKTADGHALDLAGSRGKVVVLAFWSTRWSMASVPHLKATYDAFGRDPRLAMIGLNEDFAPEAMKWCVARHNLAWEQRYLGSSDAPNPIAAAFGVRFLPAIFLVGPDGRLIARDLEGDRIKQAVAVALSKSP